MRGVTAATDHVGIVEKFQPTLPVRGVTWFGVDYWGDGYISTHTPRAGSDGDMGVEELT